MLLATTSPNRQSCEELTLSINSVKQSNDPVRIASMQSKNKSLFGVPKRQSFLNKYNFYNRYLEDFAASTRRANWHSCFASFLLCINDNCFAKQSNDLDGLTRSIKIDMYKTDYSIQRGYKLNKQSKTTFKLYSIIQRTITNNIIINKVKLKHPIMNPKELDTLCKKRFLLHTTQKNISIIN